MAIDRGANVIVDISASPYNAIQQTAMNSSVPAARARKNVKAIATMKAGAIASNAVRKR
jgi:hypothetical protein